MPLFRYFLGVGAVLLGLLFVASELVGNSEPVGFVTTDTLPVPSTKANNGTLPQGRAGRDRAANAFAYQGGEKVTGGRDAIATDRNNHLRDSHASRSKAFCHRHEIARRSSHEGGGGTW